MAVTENSYKAMSMLCKHLSISPDTLPRKFSDFSDITSFVTTLTQSVGEENIFSNPIDDNEEIQKWLKFADSLAANASSISDALKPVDEALAPQSVLASKGLCPSIADVVVFAYLLDYLRGLPSSERTGFPHLFRWADYIQNKSDFGQDFEKIKLEKLDFIPVDGTGKEDAAKKPEVKKSKKAEKEKEKPDQKKKVPEKEATQDTEISVSLLNIQVGLIKKAWKHPSADSLLVEEIDVGEEKIRQVVSGLAKYFGPDEIVNRHVLVVTNVKPGKLRDVMSSGLVLCASNEDHTKVEPLSPPEGVKVGEQVTFAGHEGNPEEVLNPKKKQLEKISTHFYTHSNGIATYKGIPFMTSAGPCKASITNASIK